MRKYFYSTFRKYKLMNTKDRYMSTLTIRIQNYLQYIIIISDFTSIPLV